MSDAEKEGTAVYAHQLTKTYDFKNLAAYNVRVI
jgi:hypothetical protein